MSTVEVVSASPKKKKESKKGTIRGKPKWSIRNPYLLISIWMVINAVWTIRNIINYLLLMVGVFLPNIPMFVPFGNPLYPSFIGLTLYAASMILMWLVFTKLDEELPKELLSLNIG